MVELSSGQLDKVVLLLMSGISPERAQGLCVARLGMSEKEATDYVAAARRKITVAADYSRDEQIGAAITRLNDLYSKSISGKDFKTALQAQRELNRLMGLYAAKAESDSDGGESNESARRLKLIESYVLPLKLIKDTYPVEEHVRVAADIARKAKKDV